MSYEYETLLETPTENQAQQNPQDAVGVDDVCTGASCWLEHNKQLVWIGGVAAGMLGMHWWLQRRKQRMLENPPPRDVKLAETAPDGSIPLRRGKHKPLDPDDFSSPSRIGIGKYVEACFELRPDLRERLGNVKMPTTPKKPKAARAKPTLSRKKQKPVYSEEEQQAHELYKDYLKARRYHHEFALPRYYRRRVELQILKLGKEWFTPEDWAKNKLYDRFRSFYMPCFNPEDYRETRRQRTRRLNRGGVSFAKHVKDRTALRIDVAMELWRALGMPNGATVTARGADTICRSISNPIPTLRRISTLIRLVQDVDTSPSLLWQVISIDNCWRLNRDDISSLAEALQQARNTSEAGRIRWWVERSIIAELHEGGDAGWPQDRLVPRFWRHYSIGWESRARKRKVSFPEYRRLSSRMSSVNRRLRVSLPWEDLSDALAEPERDFVSEYAPSPGDAYAWLYNRLPKKTGMRTLTPPTVVSIPMKQLLRIQRSPEIRNMVDEEIAIAKQEIRSEAESDIRETTDRIKHHAEQLALTEAAIKEHRKLGKGLSKERRKLWLHELNGLKRNKRRAGHSISSARRQLKRIEKELAVPLPEDAINRIKKTSEPNIQQAAVSLSVTFGSAWRSWLQKMARRNINTHDATYWLPTEASPGLGSYLLKRWQANIESLSAVTKGWNSLSTDEQSLPPREIAAILTARTYAGAKVPALAKEAAKWATPQSDYKRIEKLWQKAHTKKEQSPSTIPNYSVENEGYRLFKLPPDDPRGLFLGEYTYCCQHPMGVGEQCAWHGAYSPDGAFYIVEDSKGDIIAQAWTWRNGDDIVFDSIEGHALEDDRNKLVEALFDRLANKMINNSDATRVLTGSYISNDYPFIEHGTAAKLPEDYPAGAYSDAKNNQYLIASVPSEESP